MRERLKLLILDSLGCAIYGAKLEWCRILQDTLGELDATRTTSVWGTGQTLSSTNAALVNGTQVQGFELDDVHRDGVLHVGAVTLPALIAVAESHADLTGREFLVAALAGYEIGPRVGSCMGQEHIGQGWHSGATRRRVLGRRRRRARAQARRGADRARARHRRHAGRRPDGRAIRRHGQAHACRPLGAERALRRAARQGRLHRHRRRVRGALRRLLHHVLALARTASISRS